ncbi:MAG TPA: hypothetical protein VH419_01725 [Nocardioidaceae bacterium]|jgi:hypothetical protein
MKKLTRRTAAVGVVTLGLVGAGVAFAAWTSTGTGSGSAEATSAVDLQVHVDPATGLYPTGSKNATFTVTNQNPYAVRLITAEAATDFSVDAAHSTCNLDSLHSAAQMLNDVIPSGQTSAPHTVALSMDNNANDACQGATFGFKLTVHGASSS